MEINTNKTMPKLYFRYGAMNSGKTACLLMAADNYRKQNRVALIIKPIIDTRHGADYVGSRAIAEHVKADIILGSEDELCFVHPKVVCYLVDEAQFLSKKSIDALREISTKVPVICYGLRTNYKGELFEGSKRLLEIADSIEEIKTVCSRCERKATMNGKYKQKYQQPDEIEIGSEELYVSLCWTCWNNADDLLKQ